LAIIDKSAIVESNTPDMPTRNVNLTDHFDQFIEARVTSGRFSNASEVVREGLRLLEQREQENKAKLKWLRAAAKQGTDEIDRGEGIEVGSIENLGKFIDQLGEEVEAEFNVNNRRG
jgi:antitoxin ParD1/3/4